MTITTPPTERVGRYQLLEPIGIGPSGTVSRAKVFGVAGFERQFAIKRFHPELTSTAAMAAGLSAAARAYGSLEHPRIARMSEFGVAQGATFTAVEYVPGLDALRLIAEIRLAGGSTPGLAAGGALALVSQAARAVGYAHGRGLTHLGLAPTNVIVTADGDIKITDFGILSATLPPRPIETPRLAQRIPYLAPEQLANEATSAATDVFALGVLAYELVTGTRTFKGDTPQQVASAIMAGPPGEPALPRPIVRVLQRCLARSPFERFPDARALADALDAALRVAPVPGTRKDIGAQVKETLDRLAALNEGQMSGMVALHLGTGPIRRLDDDPGPAVPAAGDTAHEPASAPYELAPPDPATALGGAAATLSDLPRPMTTVPGLPPPPIPVPPGVGPPTVPALPGPPGSGTLLGLGRSPAAPPGSVGGVPPVPAAARRPPTRPGIDLSIDAEPDAPPRPDLSTESAVHPLDPDELEPFEPSESDDDAPPAPPPLRTAPPRAPSAADEFLDGPTQAMGDAAPPGRPPPGRPTPGRPTPAASTYRLDPSSIATRPIAPLTLEPLLGDPNMRPDPASKRPITRPVPLSEADEAWSLDDDHAFGDPAGRVPTVPITGAARPRSPGSAASRPPADPGSAASRLPVPDPGSGASRLPVPDPGSGASRLPVPDPGSGASRLPAPDPDSGVARFPILDPDSSASRFAAPDPGSGLSRLPTPALETSPNEPSQARTMLGFGPPPGTPRATTPSPYPPAVSLAPPTEPIAAAAEPSGIHSGWPREPSEIRQATAPSAQSSPQERRPQPTPPGWITAPAAPTAQAAEPVAARSSRRGLAISAGVIGAAVVGLAVWQVYVRVVARPGRRSPPLATVPSNPAPADAAQVVAATPDAAAHVAAALPDAGAAPADAARVAVVTPDAAAHIAAAPSDAGAVPADASIARDPAHVATVPPTSGDSLAIASTPPGARVFLDGADAGVTPLKLPGTPDRHNLALLLAGHELYIAQVDGHGTFQVPLKEVTPTNGPAGIKVLRCKDKERYYVFVDGKPTGQTCPSERIGCELGPHTVEVYDVVSETRRKWDIVVKDTRLSFRVRVDQ